MAKQKYYTPKKGNGVGKIVAATACALAIAAGACAVGVGTGGFKDWTFSKWFGEAQVQEGESNVNGNAVIGEGESNGVSLMSAAIAVADYDEYGIDTQAESAYNLSVTYTPSNTTFQGTTYSIAWKNPYSEWASGKNVTDYATVVQTEEGSKDAVLTVLQSFSEQIIVTAAHSRNEGIKATVTVDYVGQLNFGLDNFITLNMLEDSLIVNTSSETPFINGTLAPNGEKTVTVIIDVGWIAERVNALYDYNMASSVTFTYNWNAEQDSYGDELLNMNIKDILSKAGNVEDLSYNSAEFKTWWSNVGSAILGNIDPKTWDEDTAEVFEDITVIAHRVYNGVDYGDVEISNGACEGDGWSIFETLPTSIESNTSSIIAG